jgi:hypothetical protein
MLHAHSLVPRPSKQQQRSERLKCQKIVWKKAKVAQGKVALVKAAPPKKISFIKVIQPKTKPGPRDLFEI